MSPGRRALQVVLIVVTAVIAVVAIGLIALQTPWGRGYLADVAELAPLGRLGGDVDIGRLGGTLVSGAVIEDLRIVHEGEPVAVIDRVEVDYDIDPLAGRFQLNRVELQRPVVQGQGLAVFGGLARGNGEGRRGTVAIEEIVVRNGRVVVGPEPSEVGGMRVPDVIEELDANLAVRAGAEGTTIAIDRLSFTGEAPRMDVRSITGTIVVADNDLLLEDIAVQLAESSFEFGGTIRDFRALGAL